jgi:PilZ domain-containing protein
VTGPRVGEAVHVITPAGATIGARVKYASTGSFLLRIEDADSDPRELLAHETVSLEFTNLRGVCRIAGTAQAVADSLRVDTTGEAELIQRRDYYRVEAFVPVTYQPYGPDGATVTANTLDVSGGGFRIADAEGLRLWDMLRFTLELGEGEDPVQAVAQAVREADEDAFGMRFVEIVERERQRLVRWVFARERLARQITRHP